ncbi:hypothetical protein [Flavobacterium sp.]|uniref:hypothetical protein n=1 Tax=Flavobacterium sp. TaxID=239 RepID=UPI0028BF1FB3|nr:hypothetical protein [Flavobacterium sp.]
MKTVFYFVAVAALAITTTSCKDEKKEIAETNVNNYATYVDSITGTDAKEAALNWEEIEATTLYKKEEAEKAAIETSDKTEFEGKINTTTDKFEAFKMTVEKAQAAENPKQTLRKSLFGDVEIGDDMNFGWVNKDNALKVYDNFVTTVDNNKDAYSREDWDEIKLLYEALDAHKNTVEKNGLSAEDNRKIAGLKIKFSTMYKLNRISAKSAENAAAKE